MGQAIVCFLCGCGRDRVVPLKADTDARFAESSEVESRPVEFLYDCKVPQVANLPLPCEVSLGSAGISDLSHGTSMATISLGSEQTISSASLENLTRQDQSNTNVEDECDGLDCSSLHFRRPGLWTPEPQDSPLPASIHDLTPKPANQNSTQAQRSAQKETVRWQTPATSFSRSVTIGHTSPSTLPLQNPTRSSANVSVSSSRHTRASTPIPRGPMLIKVQPCRGQDANEPLLQDSGPAPRVCKHGVVLDDDDQNANVDIHEVRCVKCERPQSKGGRMLQQLMEKRKNEKMLKRQRKAEKKRLMEEEQERRRLAKEAIDSALQKFVDSQMQKEETK